MLITVILSISLLLQITAVILVLRLTRFTKKSISWLFIATAIFLMGVRRTVPLSRILLGDPMYKSDLIAELIALAISLLLVIGIALIAPSFRHSRTVEKTHYYRKMVITVIVLFAGLSMLVWLNEIFDLPHILIGAPYSPINWRESLIEMALICLLGLYVVSRILYYITEGARAERALRESEARYKELFDNMSSGVAIYEAKENGDVFVFKDLNRAGERIDKTTKEAVLGRSVAEMFPGVKKFGLFKVFQRVWRSGKAEHHPVSLYKDKRVVGWRENYIYKLPSEELVAVYDDVTERKLMEMQTRHLNSVLRSIRNVNQIITMEKSQNRLLKQVCNTLIETRGYHNVWILITDESGKPVHSYESGFKEGFKEMLAHLKNGAQPFCWREARSRPDAVVIDAPAKACGDCPLSVIHTKQGVLITRLSHGKKVYGFIAATIPKEFITDTEEHALFKEVSGDIAFALYNLELEAKRKKAERALQRLATVVKISNDAITVQDFEGSIIEWNHGAEKMYGWSTKEALTMNVRDMMPLNRREEALDLINKIRRGESVESFETQRITKDRRLLDVWLTAARLVDEKGKSFIAVIERDITARKQAETEQKRLSRELLQKNREFEQMLYVTSHDLRSPLVNVQGFSKEIDLSIQQLISVIRSDKLPESLRKKCISLIEDDIKPSIGYIHTSVSKMDALLSGLLKLSRLGRQQIKIKKLPMNKVVSEVIKTFEYIIKEKGIKLEITKLPPCMGDELQVNQVFSNLLGNALKFLHPTRKGIISISGRKEEDHSIYSIKDNGIGITPVHKEKIFELFHKLDPSQPGEGLGLATVRKILEKHSGNIRLESKPDAGSTFIISLPAA